MEFRRPLQSVFGVFLLVCLHSLAIPTALDAQSDPLPDSKNYIIKLTERGVEPALLELRPNDSVVFFLNTTKEALASLEVSFEEKTMHCASANMRVDDDRVLRSTAPFGPQDFATTCFHSPGKYTYKVYGLPNNPKGITGTVILR